MKQTTVDNNNRFSITHIRQTWYSWIVNDDIVAETTLTSYEPLKNMIINCDNENTTKQYFAYDGLFIYDTDFTPSSNYADMCSFFTLPVSLSLTTKAINKK